MLCYHEENNHKEFNHHKKFKYSSEEILIVKKLHDKVYSASSQRKNRVIMT